MISAPIASWLDVLWEAVCLRSARPISGILLESSDVAEVAKSSFTEFLERGGQPEATLQAMLTVLSRPAQERALQYVAHQRTQQNDSELLRDPEKKFWEQNPTMPALIIRGSQGELTSKEWSFAEPIMWKRATPVYRRLRINETDSRDVYAETIGDFLKARSEEKGCPFSKVIVFEELPRLFAVVAERRAISWVRKQTTLKMQPNQTGLSLDDPDLHLHEPRTLEEQDPLTNATFENIREQCSDILDEFEWHLVETLFVEGSKTRDELVLDDWVLTQLEVDLSASRSTKLRRLNAVVADALARLGRALKEADL